MKGKLIVLEGIDGVGKTTCAHLLKKALVSRGIPAIVYEDQEARTAGFNKIKAFVTTEAPIDASFLFYIASAIYKSTKIQELLKTKWVICDRYIYSTLASHRARGARTSLITDIHKLPIRLPDFHFLLKVKEAVRIRRASVRDNRTLQDRVPKRKGSTPAKMERALETFSPIIVDNTNPDVHVAMNKIIQRIFSGKGKGSSFFYSTV